MAWQRGCRTGFVSPPLDFGSPIIVRPLPAVGRFAGMMNSTMQNAASGSNESHVDRARRGPTPDNPSLSLKTRLKRAAFFDKRDREVAAGKAAPVDTDAGLPDAVADDALMAGWSSGSPPDHRPSA